MKKVFLIVLGTLAAAVLTMLALGATQPAEFRVERSTVISAAPATVYALVSDFRRFSEWSPWEKLDPNMKRTHSGSERGIGAVYEWAGNDDVGEGRMTIVDAVPERRVDVKLEFLKPWEATNQTSWTLEGNRDQTKVTWAMAGRNEGLIARTFSMLMDMDKMVGADFERGLAAMKQVAERDEKRRSAAAAGN